MKWPADRITNSAPKSFGMYEKTLPLMRKGIDVIHLEVGRPDFDTPVHIKEATKAALDSGQVHYSDFAGLLRLREAIVTRLAGLYGLDYTPEEILVTNGLTHASYIVLTAAIDPGDEVVVLEPYYPQHINKIELAGGKVVYAQLNARDGFRIDAARIEEKITHKTRMIALVNPANPTGRVFTRAELESVAEIARAHDLLIMSDEVYDTILYDGHRHNSIASLPGMREHTFSLYAFTKSHAMDGWRLGYLAADSAFLPALKKISMNDVAHVNTFIQHGAIAALEGPQAPVEAMLAEDALRREMVCARLDVIPGVSCPPPQGTIYAFPDVSELRIPSAELAGMLLEKAHVAVEAGSFYGPAGEGHLRVCFGAEPRERIEEGLERMAAFFATLPAFVQ